MIDTDHVISLARECMGTPFVHQARVPGVGLDCAGLLVHVLDSLGLPHVDERGYPRRPYRGLIKSILDSQPSLQSIPKSDMAPGDVFLMWLTNTREPMHVAIFTGPTIVHAYSVMGRVVEQSMTLEWRKHISTVYRIVEPVDVER